MNKEEKPVQVFHFDLQGKRKKNHSCVIGNRQVDEGGGFGGRV